MKRYLTIAFILLLFSVAILALASKGVYAEISCSDYTNADLKKRCEDIENQIKIYEAKLNDARSRETDLKKNIDYLDNQIYLSKLRIAESEVIIEKRKQDIENLLNKILLLEDRLDKNTKLFLKRINLSYKQGTFKPYMIFFASGSLDDKVSRYKYLQTVQSADRAFLFKIQETKNSYKEQKQIVEREKKALEAENRILEQRKQSLASQIQEKETLLLQTQSEEKIYQELLSKARSEYEAIQNILSGGGKESSLREVKKNDIIASVINGPSCNSSGRHLHFIIEDNGTVVNPFSYLKSVDFSNCSGSSCGSGDGDPFSPSGNFDWPLSPPIELEQGYGATWSITNTWVGQIYSFHNGVDINGTSNDVQAISDGTLYQGSYSGANNCALYYVKLKHKDSNMTSYYLHVYSK